MKVSDADRRIAEEALGYDYAIMPTEAEQREIVELAEYFARHRHEAIEMAARVAEEWFPAETASTYPKSGVVASIRALA